MSRAAKIRRFGAPEVFEIVEEDIGDPGPTQVRIRQTAIGVNYADVYMRSGNHPAPLVFPATLGVEAAGVVQDFGENVLGIRRGDRVAYFGVIGAYAQSRLIPAELLVKLPEHIDDLTAAASLIKAVTAQYLCREVFPVRGGQTVLVHAAAGGVGSLLAQWSSKLGAMVIGTVGSEKKAELARANGCHHVIVSTREDFVSKVVEITGGEKVSVVFDSLGKDISTRSLDCLRTRGTLVMYGRTAGYPEPLNPADLMVKGSLTAVMTQLKDFAGTPAAIQTAVTRVFEAILAGELRPAIGQRYSLSEVAQAHRDLEARATTASSVLIP